jgi:hypothetical protein
MIDALAAMLRKHPEPTDGTSIARSVRTAKTLLARSVAPPR